MTHQVATNPSNEVYQCNTEEPSSPLNFNTKIKLYNSNNDNINNTYIIIIVTYNTTSLSYQDE